MPCVLSKLGAKHLLLRGRAGFARSGRYLSSRLRRAEHAARGRREEKLSRSGGSSFSSPVCGHPCGLRAVLELVELLLRLRLGAVEVREVVLRHGLRLLGDRLARLLNQREALVELAKALAPRVLAHPGVHAFDLVEVDLGQAQLTLPGIDLH